LELWIPYGQTEVPVRVPDDNFYRILESTRREKRIPFQDLLSQSLDNPVDSFHLTNFSKPGTVAGIILDPHVPKEIREIVLQQLTSQLNAIGMSGTRIFTRKRYSISQPVDIDTAIHQLDPVADVFGEIGKTSLGTPLNLSQELMGCGVKIAVTLAQPHFASGFTGGPESILPGSASAASIQKNRSLLTKGFSHPTSLNDNQVLSDMLEACKLAGPIYNICLVPDGNGGFDSVFAGELEKVFRTAVARYLEVHSPKLERRPDIVLLSAGQFTGQDLYHAVRVLSNVASIVKRDGTIILVAECSNGVGDSTFHDYARKFPDRKQLGAELRYRFRLGTHVNLFLYDILEKFRVELVSVLPNIYSHNVFQLKPCRTASEAIQKAVRVQGKESKILVVNQGDYTLPVLESS
jgi:nickel-dependent lactate racemase